MQHVGGLLLLDYSSGAWHARWHARVDRQFRPGSVPCSSPQSKQRSAALLCWCYYLRGLLTFLVLASARSWYEGAHWGAWQGAPPPSSSFCCSSWAGLEPFSPLPLQLVPTLGAASSQYRSVKPSIKSTMPIASHCRCHSVLPVVPVLRFRALVVSRRLRHPELTRSHRSYCGWRWGAAP